MRPPLPDPRWRSAYSSWFWRSLSSAMPTARTRRTPSGTSRREDMKIVDPHMHLCNLGTLRYPWLANPNPDWLIGPYGAIAKAHQWPDFLQDAGEIEVLKIVHIENGVDPADRLAESAWLQATAADPKFGSRPNGIVAAADLSDPGIEAALEAQKAIANVRGIRQILNVHANPTYD